MSSDYDEALPADFDPYIDFTTNCMFLVMGFILRTVGFIKVEHLPGMQMLTFTFCLPVMVMGVLWNTRIQAEVMTVLAASATTHTLWALSATGAASHSLPKSRGFYLMCTTASAMAYVYPVVLRSDRFGVNFIPVVVMWELGGNLLVAVFFQGAVAEAYAPKKVEDSSPRSCTFADFACQSSLDFAEVSVTPQPTYIGARLRGRSNDPGGSLPKDEIAEQDGLPVTMVDVVPADPGRGQEVPYLSRSSSSRMLMLSSASVLATSFRNTSRRLGVVLVRTPLVWGIFVGLVLNVTKVPFTELPGRAVTALAGSFSPMLYAVLGASLRFNLGRSSYRTVAIALACRWLANGVFIAFVWLILPFFLSFDRLTLGVMTLCIAAPIPTTFVMYSGMYGYQMDEVSMAKNVSDMVSMVALVALVIII